MGQIIYESKRKKTPGYAVPVRVLLVRRAGGKGRFVRVEEWDDEQNLYVPDRLRQRHPWPWDAVQDLGERVCALREENRKLRAQLLQVTGSGACCREEPGRPLETGRQEDNLYGNGRNALNLSTEAMT